MSNPEEWREKLRARGQRLTAQRELVLAAVEKLGHATPDEVLTEVHKSSKAVSLSTIYRTLTLLEELDLVRHAHLQDRAPTYHSVTSPPHAHTVCRSCRNVQEVPQSALDPLVGALSDAQGFTVDIPHLTVFGICEACRSSD